MNVDAAFAKAMPLFVSQLSFKLDCAMNLEAAYLVKIVQLQPKSVVRLSIVVISYIFTVSVERN